MTTATTSTSHVILVPMRPDATLETLQRLHAQWIDDATAYSQLKLTLDMLLEHRLRTLTTKVNIGARCLL